MPAQINISYIKQGMRPLLKRLLCYFFFEGRPVTTFGYFWNKPLSWLYKFLIKKDPNKYAKPFYIGGIGRSGTTILGTILSVHRDIAFLNEPKLLWYNLFPNDDIIGSYNNGSANYFFDIDNLDQNSILKARSLFGWVSKISYSKFVLDKYPESVFRFDFLNQIFPGTKILLLTRPAQETALSICQWNLIHQTESRGSINNWWGVNDRKWNLLLQQVVPVHDDLMEKIEEIKTMDDFGRAIIEWIVTMRQVIEISYRFPDNALMIPYNSLCVNPDFWLTKIFEFIDLEASQNVVDFAYSELKSKVVWEIKKMPIWLDLIVCDIEQKINQIYFD